MNAPAAIQTKDQRYDAIVRGFMPTILDVEVEARCKILRWRDHAAYFQPRATCDEAAELLAMVARLASLLAYQPMSLRQLEALDQQLRRLVACANGLTRLQDSIAEGVHGRG